MTGIVERLRQREHDITNALAPSAQAVYRDAADEIERLHATLRAIEALGCAVDAPWMCLSEAEHFEEMCGPCLAHGHLHGLLELPVDSGRSKS